MSWRLLKEEVLLRSVHDMRGYTVHAQNGTVGQVDQFLFDDRVGKIRYLVMRISGWLFGRHVLILPQVLSTITRPIKALDIALTMRQIEHNPGIKTNPPVLQQQSPIYVHTAPDSPGSEILPESWFRDVSQHAAPSTDDCTRC